ncbi:MAG: proline racemase family protein [Lentisphaeraceae bacterium]|nr:proline racemase family protein [Lentisphaeraceae bacterium]
MEIEIIDSHTGGEPTRLVLQGWPDVEGNTMADRLQYVQENYDHIRKAVVCEPRGHNAIVGALLTPPVNPGSLTGVIYFNDVGFLGMCGHATIGLVETLRLLGRLNSDEVFIDTPVGTVSAKVGPDNSVSIRNISPRVHIKDLSLNVPGLGKVTGDVAYGGNWFYLVNSLSPEISLNKIDELMATCKSIRNALKENGICGDDGHLIDHVELFSNPTYKEAHSKNFVLCPGNAYDRSPCGTGTSAKMASLYEKGLLGIGEKWVQEGVCGSVFNCSLEMENDSLVPVISSKAYVTSRSTLFLNEEDPFCWGI